MWSAAVRPLAVLLLVPHDHAPVGRACREARPMEVVRAVHDRIAVALHRREGPQTTSILTVDTMVDTEMD